MKPWMRTSGEAVMLPWMKPCKKMSDEAMLLPWMKPWKRMSDEAMDDNDEAMDEWPWMWRARHDLAPNSWGLTEGEGGQ